MYYYCEECDTELHERELTNSHTCPECGFEVDEMKDD